MKKLLYLIIIIPTICFSQTIGMTYSEIEENLLNDTADISYSQLSSGKKLIIATNIKNIPLGTFIYMFDKNQVCDTVMIILDISFIDAEKLLIQSGYTKIKDRVYKNELRTIILIYSKEFESWVYVMS